MTEPFDLRRYLFDALRPPPEPVAGSADFPPEWLPTLAAPLETLAKLPAGDRPDLVFNAARERKGKVLFGRGLGESGRLGVWIIDGRIFDRLPDPFFWMAEYPMAAGAKAIGAEVELPKAIPPRTVEKLAETFRAGDGPLLIGGAQALVDGASVRLRRNRPDAKAIADLWQFLPDSTRRGLPFQSFCTGELPARGIAVVPENAAENLPGWLGETQCGDYPESPFEKRLQYAIDNGDQDLFDKLMDRRSPEETLRLAAAIVVIALLALAISKLVMR